MKKILRDAIVNLPDTDIFDETFVFEYLEEPQHSEIEIIYLRDLLEEKKNESLLEKVQEKPAMWSNVYSPKDELEIFTSLFESAIQENKKIHIIGVTL